MHNGRVINDLSPILSYFASNNFSTLIVLFYKISIDQFYSLYMQKRGNNNIHENRNIKKCLNEKKN